MIQHPNEGILELVALQIEPLLPELVFVGGQVAELLITDPAAVRVRPTKDVDVVVPATTRAEYAVFEEQLRRLGFRNDQTDGAPICRWVSASGHRVDLLPVEGTVLGFSNRWYPRVIESSQPFRLSASLSIRIPTPPLFVATKLEAFARRGSDDLLGSHDLEDVITVVAGRPSLSDEVRDEPVDVREWLQDSFRSLLARPDFLYAIQGALPDAVAIPGYLEEIESRFVGLASAP